MIINLDEPSQLEIAQEQLQLALARGDERDINYWQGRVNEYWHDHENAKRWLAGIFESTRQALQDQHHRWIWNP